MKKVILATSLAVASFGATLPADMSVGVMLGSGIGVKADIPLTSVMPNLGAEIFLDTWYFSSFGIGAMATYNIPLDSLLPKLDVTLGLGLRVPLGLTWAGYFGYQAGPGKLLLGTDAGTAGIGYMMKF